MTGKRCLRRVSHGAWGVLHPAHGRARYLRKAYYLRLPLERAAHQVVMEDLDKVNGEGGVIALDRDGTMTMPFNTPGMYRGYIAEDGVPHVMIFR